MEFFIECFQNGGPLLVTFGYFVELLFDARSEVVVKDVREVLYQEVIDHNTGVCRHQF